MAGSKLIQVAGPGMRRRRVRKRDFRQRNPTNKNLSKRIRKIEDNQELKWKDTDIDVVPLANNPGTAQVILLNGLTQGDTSTTRDGSLVSFTSIQCRAEITSLNSTTSGFVYRILVVRDSQANAAAPLATQILDDSGFGQLMFAPYSRLELGRFKIVYDKMGHFNHFIANTVYHVPIKFKKKLSSKTNYGRGNAGTIADIVKNSYYMILLSDQPLGGTSTPIITASVRMYFKDD